MGGGEERYTYQYNMWYSNSTVIWISFIITVDMLVEIDMITMVIKIIVIITLYIVNNNNSKYIGENRNS